MPRRPFAADQIFQHLRKAEVFLSQSLTTLIAARQIYECPNPCRDHVTATRDTRAGERDALLGTVQPK